MSALLRVPLFGKLLVADTVVGIAAVCAGAWLARRAPPGASLFAHSAFVPVALLAATVTIAINGLIVFWALRPIRLLERAAADVAAGRNGVRAPMSAFADPDFARVVRTFNAALDAAEASRTRVRAVAARSISSAEAQRRRIATELHEGVAQTLAAARLRLRLARGATGSDLQAAQLETLSTELAEVIEALRGIALDLRPLALDVMGLGPAVENFARSVGTAAGLNVRVHCDTGEWHVSDEAELGVYRILEEAVANVVRHAEASELTVDLRVSPYGSAQLTVEDDGNGFDAASRIAAPDSLGLAGMQERAGWLGGRVEIRSTPGAGTRIIAEVPVTGPAAADVVAPA